MFISNMEKVLDTYEKEYDPEVPVICFDERPCQLIADVMMPTLPGPEKPGREDYHYKRQGTCVVLLAVEPLTGKRIVEVRKRKTKKDYALFMKKLQRSYPKARSITLIQDNLNTHNASAFYENFTSDKAFEMMNFYNMVYTPKKASWLNMAEIEFSALSKQCLDRRIAYLNELQEEVMHWMKQRNHKKVKIRWQFTQEKAREKFHRIYKSIRN